MHAMTNNDFSKQTIIIIIIIIIITNTVRKHGGGNNKQLLDEVKHDIMNYQIRGLCYRHEVLIIHDIMRKPNSIIVLLYIFHITHPQKQKRSVRPFCF